MQQQYQKTIERKDREHRKEVPGLKRFIEKLCIWFPLATEILRTESLCLLTGLDERESATLVCNKPPGYAGKLYSVAHKRKFTTEKAGFQVVKEPTDKAKLFLVIERKPISEWFKDQFDKLRQTIHRPMQPQKKNKGIKL